MEYYVFQDHIFETLFHECQTCTIKKPPPGRVRVFPAQASFPYG
ncbi:hypothetical protein SACS_0217 [Parasaccharibacter apium]|uniref:Uncharacterized protein n=1 Tax=Parasaccharibacter apium TaxID=1510841 RepID=A0A7U7G4K9_9PROT|nr:hypothetical protein SACS_0217 [Parasaccharibacter apium]